jgi:outer membrane lipoprotein-sorting protein
VKKLKYLLCSLLLVTAPAWAQGSTLGLPQLMGMLAQVPSATVQFTEQKQVAMLDKPLTMSGVLSYSRPNFVEKHTLAPEEELIQVNGNQLLWAKPAKNQRHVITLQRDPALWALIESIRGTLTGNLAALQQVYTIQVGGTARHWSLQLAPLDSRLQRYMRTVRFTGSGNQIRTIDIVDKNGDNDIMTLAKATQ